jgi:maltooligosyltrehalose trehalohydrolase
MTVLRIWAPKATAVELVTAGDRRPMTAEDGGWFAAPMPPWNTDYQLSLDGGPPMPDPRSELQPAGLHGPSRRLDHAAYAWQAPHFRAPPLASALIYELHVGTFTEAGTFAAAIDRLDHLAELGVTHVELMPVNTFPGRRGWGYDGVALYAPHPAYGTPDDLRRLVDACHQRGLAALLDVVYNHLGPDGNYLGAFGPYFTDRVKTPWGDAVNLDGPGADESRAFFLDNAVHWLRHYHFDGLRLDAVHAFHDESALPFLEELASRVDGLEAELERPLVLIAESDRNDPRLVRPRDAGGLGLDAQWSDDFHHALHSALTGEVGGYYRDFGGLATLARSLTHGWVHDGRRSAFRGHRHGRPYGDPVGSRLLGYLQTHDQVGNRATGDRIGHGISAGRLRIGAALVLTSPYVPMLFAGEEWNASAPFQYFTDHESPELAEAVRQGRRREFAAFGWKPDDIPDPQAESTFRRSILDWSERDREPHAGVLAWYRALIDLRRRRPELRDGRLDQIAVDADEASGRFVVRRGGVTVAANLGAAPLALERPPGDVVLAYPDRLDSADGRITLAPDGVIVLATPA